MCSLSIESVFDTENQCVVSCRFAAEVFRDLHEEFVSVGGRAHDLTVRVQQLEAELPAVEKALLSEPNQLRFAYTNGTETLHLNIAMDRGSRAIPRTCLPFVS